MTQPQAPVVQPEATGTGTGNQAQPVTPTPPIVSDVSVTNTMVNTEATNGACQWNALTQMLPVESGPGPGLPPEPDISASASGKSACL